MPKLSLWDRLLIVKDAMHLETDVALFRLAGADKGMAHQWKSGKVQSLGAQYAWPLQDATGFSARWLQLGEGAMKIDRELATVIRAWPLLDDGVKKMLLLTAQAAIEQESSGKSNVA